MMQFKFPRALVLAAIMAGSALAPLPAMAAKTELTLGAAAADIGNLDPHYSASTTDRTLVAWIFGGLVRFDGVRMVVYSRSDVPLMPTNRITCLFVDRHGTLWAGTEDAGILEKRGETFRVHRRAEGVPGEEIAHLAEDEAGTLWADTNSGYAIHQAGRWTTPQVIRPLPAAWRSPRPSYPATAAHRLRRGRRR